MKRHHGEEQAGTACQVCTSPQSSGEWNTNESRRVGQQNTQTAALRESIKG